MGFSPDLKNPQTHAEFTMRKMISEAGPMMVMTADKVLVREYVKEKVGEKYCYPLIYAGTIPETFPDNCVIKVNNACGRNIFKRNGRALFRGKKVGPKTIKRLLRLWLKDDYARGGVHYTKINPQVLIEPILDSVHIICKLNSWRGYAPYIHMTKYDIGSGALKIIGRTWYDRDWNKLPMANIGKPNIEFQKPLMLEDMLRVSKILSEPFDYCRVDLFLKDEKFWVNELTHCSSGGAPHAFNPIDWQFKFGEFWKQNFNNQTVEAL